MAQRSCYVDGRYEIQRHIAASCACIASILINDCTRCLRTTAATRGLSYGSCFVSDDVLYTDRV